MQLSNYILVSVLILHCISLGKANKGSCYCGAFTDLEHLDKAIVERDIPFNDVECDQQGLEDCKNSCIQIANTMSNHEKGQLLCHYLKKDIKLPELHLLARNCDNKKWTQTAHKSSKSICCKGGKHVAC